MVPRRPLAVLDELLIAVLRGDLPPWARVASVGGMNAMLAAARRHGVEPLLADRLGSGASHDWPRVVVRRIADTAADEPSRVFLRSNLTKAHILLSDLRQFSGWRRHLQLVREHLFPPVVYMRATYDTHSALLLPMRYVTRIGAGVT
ncbi:MAG: hypothetical protein VYE68_12945, partial [Acidobacteriota bacterium]|nr:hypothetical protein [Acidobacteriota bacterium]